MEQYYAWLGDLNDIPGLGREWIGLIAILASAVCGGVIGVERERQDKPAGLRTLVLIAVGSTIFTCVSLLLGEKKAIADPARLASQIIPGIGFLGAGAIIQARGMVRGLTTGATIWAVAAVGVVIGAGFVAAGLVFTAIILLTLTLLRGLESVVIGRCRFQRTRLVYHPDSGKTQPRLQEILDRYRIPDKKVNHDGREPEGRVLECKICLVHREHRSILKELADVPRVVSLKVE